MAIVPLPLPQGAEARALLHHLLEHGDIVGEDATGRTIVQLALDDWVLEKLMGFDAEPAELEDGGDGEPDADAEEDWLPVVLLDVVRPKVVTGEASPIPDCQAKSAEHMEITGALVSQGHAFEAK